MFEILVCIENNNCEKELTINEKYRMIYSDQYYFNVINNNNECGEYKRRRFISLSEYEKLHRKDKLNKMLK